MPVRTLLSSEQRTRLFSIPTDMAAETVSNLGGGMGSAEMAGSGKWDEVARYGRVDRGQRHRLHL
jgi:hypothetical protein